MIEPAVNVSPEHGSAGCRCGKDCSGCASLEQKSFIPNMDVRDDDAERSPVSR